jgi:hypothetical protein
MSNAPRHTEENHPGAFFMRAKVIRVNLETACFYAPIVSLSRGKSLPVVAQHFLREPRSGEAFAKGIRKDGKPK